MEELQFDYRVFLTLSAPFIGSFLGVVVSRNGSGHSIIKGRSRCPRCGHVLGWRDLVPVVSWLANGGKCAYCRDPIGLFDPAIEVGALVIAIWSWVSLPSTVAWAGCIYGWTLLALAAIDLRSFRLPHGITWPLAAGGVLVRWLIGADSPVDGLLGAAIGFAFFMLVAGAYRRLREREGLGEGDACLLAAVGAWVGWQGIPGVVLIACLSGLAWVAIRAVLGRPAHALARLPFGPHLCIGGWIVWLYGPIRFG